MPTPSIPGFEADIAASPTRRAAQWGFRAGECGTHASRTMMLGETMKLLLTLLYMFCSMPDWN